MPRITKATRTSLPVNSGKYDLNSSFRDYVNGNKYKSQDSLVLWSDFCDPGIVSTVANFEVVGDNQSSRYSDDRHKLYSKQGTSFSSFRREDNQNFCGNKCYFYYEATSQAASGVGNAYSSPLFLKLTDHNDLSFVDGGSDKPFTISFWLYSRARSGVFNVNWGGSDSSGRLLPTFFEKYQEYSLQIDDRGRLRMTIYAAGGTSNYIYAETITSAFLDDTWNNIVVSYDGSGSPSGIDVYRNGHSIKDPSRSATVGSYTSMSNTASEFSFGAGSPSNPTKLTSMPGLPGGGLKVAPVFIAELSIWESLLSDEEVKALYHATLTCAATDTARESGYTSEPPRLRIRRLDSATGSYPTVKRTGDRDFKGDFKVKFDDLNTLVFGGKIVDEFTNIEPREPFSKNIDKNKWVFTSGLEIRRESLTGVNGGTFQDGVLVFNGPGERSIRTKQKLRNASIYFELIQGPHNLVTNILGEGLRLEKPTTTETLKLQFSVDDGGSWTTIREYNPELLISFYGLEGRDSFDVDSLNNVAGTRYRKRIDIHFTEIPAGDKEYYLRFVQESTTRANKSVWGIGRIEINTMQQKIRYPLLVDHEETAGKRVSQKAIMTPHTRSDIDTVGRTLPFASDHFVHFTPGENLSPFKEDHAVEILDPTNVFHGIGTDPQTGLPGFSSRLADKTKVTIDLDASGVTIGHTDNAPTETPFDVDPSSTDVAGVFINPFTFKFGYFYKYTHPLMCLYNNKSKSWERRDLPPTIHPNHTVEEYATSHAHLGFGPTDLVATRSSGANLAATEIVEQYGKDVLSNYVRPVKTFGFPFSEKYEMDSDQTVKIANYINKPFALEKVIVDFDAAFEFAPVGSNGEHSYALHQNYNKTSLGPSTRRSIDQHRVIIPTFFIVNQFNDGFSTTQPLRGERTLKKDYVLNYTSSHRSRELVTYGQMTLFISSSNSNELDLDKALSDGLQRDLNIDVLEATGQAAADITSTSVQPFTSSFRLEFPCRTSPKTGFNQRVLLRSSSASGDNNGLGVSMFMSDHSGGRNYEGFERGSRGLINNYPGITPGTKYKTFSVLNSADTVSVSSVSANSIDKASPYVLLPGDELIFGWQYPVNLSYAEFTNGLNDTGHKNIMQILGNTRVHLYGSLMSDGREYHEYNNTPLTSNAIHEVIGSEKPIDQFSAFTRGELSGSYVDQWVATEEIWDNPAFGVDPITIFTNTSEKPDVRIGKKVLSIDSIDNFGIEKELDKLYAGLTPGDRLLRKKLSLGLMTKLSERPQIQRFVRMKESNKFYLDSIFPIGKFYAGSTYGTTQNYFKLHGSGYNSELDPSRRSGKTLRYPGRPKCYFNHDHFGYFSDNVQQGKDSVMWSYVGPTYSPEPGTLVTGEEADSADTSDTNTPPVVVQFVSGTNTNDSRIRIYRKSNFQTLFNIHTNPERHAMYNSSIYSTSSKPYLDNERTEIFTENIR